MISFRLAAAGFFSIAALAQPLSAQDDAGAINVQHQITAGSDLENYLRYLQVLSKAADHPWSVRPFSPSQLEDMAAETRDHPWAHRYKLASPARRFVEVGVISPRVNLFFNSSFPYGSNDGPVWVGRGLTSQLQAGVFARVGPLTLTLAPLVFRAENVDYPGSDTLST